MISRDTTINGNLNVNGNIKGENIIDIFTSFDITKAGTIYEGIIPEGYVGIFISKCIGGSTYGINIFNANSYTSAFGYDTPGIIELCCYQFDCYGVKHYTSSSVAISSNMNNSIKPMYYNREHDSHLGNGVFHLYVDTAAVNTSHITASNIFYAAGQIALIKLS